MCIRDRLKAVSPVRLLDFEHPENNTFHCSAEFTCTRDEDEFRPDITPVSYTHLKFNRSIRSMDKVFQKFLRSGRCV